MLLLHPPLASALEAEGNSVHCFCNKKHGRKGTQRWGGLFGRGRGVDQDVSHVCRLPKRHPNFMWCKCVLIKI